MRVRRPGRPRSVLQTAFVRFAVLSLVTLLILGAVTAAVSRRIATDEAVRDARTRSEAIARTIAAPLVDARVRAGEPDAVAALDTALRNVERDGSVRHIVLWDAQGRVLWAEDARVVGGRFPLSEPLEDLVLTGGSRLESPDGRGPHPGREDGEEDLIEVYVGTVDADGVPFLFEAYLPAEQVEAGAQAVFRMLLPLSLSLLLLLQVATLPSSISLARRVDRLNSRQSRILRRSLESWHEERRRLAHVLHDGVIQDLAAVSYALPGVIDRLAEDASADAARDTGRRMADLLEQDLAALRSIILDLAPADLDGSGLLEALEAVRRQAEDQGLVVSMEVEPGLHLGETVGGLVYRVVREGLRNVAKHAGARHASVRVRRREDLVEVLIDDDGRGVPSSADREGHMGLRLLGHLVRDLGGRLEFGSGASQGASLRVTVPPLAADVDPS